ncbi:probable cytochrome P450 6a13 [Zophobas morio]|uniref:probable cytochrome P450 6a13 n=1 Tax=Zophobas morio TaxID=2755281 RepID=UPI003083555B
MFITNSIITDLIALFVTLAALFITYWKWTYQYWQRHNIPYLPPQIPFGNITSSVIGNENLGVAMKKIYDKMKRNRSKHAGIYMFNRCVYFPIDLDYIRNIMTKDFHYFVDRDFYVNRRDPLQAHLANLTGSEWKSMRTKLTPTFTSGKMKMMFQVMAECQNDLLMKMQEECLKNKPIDIKDVLARFTTNIIGSCAFGLECKALEDEDSEFRKYGKQIFVETKFVMFKRIFGMAFPKVAKFLNLSTIRMDVADFILKTVEDTIEYREKNNYNRNDFLQLMMKLKNNPSDPDEKPLTMDEVASQCFVFFGAGFETSSTLMSFALYELANHQDIQEKLRAEINSVLDNHDKQIIYDSIQDMKYLSQVIDETLRKHPPAAFLNRTCVKDYKVPGEDLVIEKGKGIMIPVLGIHYDEEYYPNASQFDPERFNDENKNSRHNFAYLPFGEGPRNCIGMRFGLLQSKLGLVCLIQNYKFTINKKTQEPLRYKQNSIVLAAEGEIWLNAQKI